MFPLRVPLRVPSARARAAPVLPRPRVAHLSDVLVWFGTLSVRLFLRLFVGLSSFRLLTGSPPAAAPPAAPPRRGRTAAAGGGGG